MHATKGRGLDSKLVMGVFWAEDGAAEIILMNNGRDERKEIRI